MASWYQVKIRFQKEDSAGKLLTINETYLFDAVSYTEAEANGYKRIVTGASDFSVTAINRMRLADLFTYEDGEKWFKAKVIYFSVDEKSGKEKKVVNYMLVNADGIDQALSRITESLRNMLIPYETTDINLTPILEVFPYTGEEEPAIPANLKPIGDVMHTIIDQVAGKLGPEGGEWAKQWADGMKEKINDNNVEDYLNDSGNFKKPEVLSERENAPFEVEEK